LLFSFLNLFNDRQQQRSDKRSIEVGVSAIDLNIKAAAATKERELPNSDITEKTQNAKNIRYETE
jgi:hypothetical protein